MIERSERNTSTLALNIHPYFPGRPPHEEPRVSAGTGCYCCQVLFDCVQKLEIIFEAKYIGLHWTVGDKVTHGCEPPGALFSMRSGNKTEQIQLFTVPADGSAPYGRWRNRIASGNTASNMAASRARAWISDCISNHRRCSCGDPTKLPTRGVDISPLDDDSGDIVLRQTAKQNLQGRYVALSHCWGGLVPACCTTRANLQAQQSRIPLGSLPQTFRDAVIFARKLGIQYLWIDTLCILQDDEADWHREAVQMCEVYGNAFVTLAAVHSQNCHGGLFTETGPGFEQHELSTFDVDGISCKIYARRPFPTFHTWLLDCCGGSAPLLRAWAYQERLVSPRVLYFTQFELLWECFEDAGCECISEMTDRSEPSDYSLSKFWCPKISYAVSLEGHNLSSSWYHVVQTYSSLALSVQTDRLPAIGGVAKQSAKLRTGERYIAGCWSGTFLLDLLWNCRCPPAPKPSKWCAPSWSSASTGGPVF
jgi:hypothetical protein